jgi:opacity protein-like surface antigen
MASKRAVSLVAASFLLCARSQAAETPEGWYAGLSSDATHVEVWRGRGWEMGGDVDGWSLRGGYRMSRHFAVEAAMLRADGLEWTEYLSTIPGGLVAHSRFDTEGLQITAAGVVPFGQIWEFHGRGGLAWSRLAGQQVLEDLWGTQSSRSFADSGRGYLLGFGLGANVTDRWTVRFDYQFFAVDGDALGVSNSDDPTIDTLGVGVHYRFGRRTPTTRDMRP